jgi:serine/threonine-protein kinase
VRGSSRAYRILRPRPRRAWRAVFLAEDESLHARWANHGAGPSATPEDDSSSSRFQREARAAAGLNHPNIVQIYDRGQADGAVLHRDRSTWRAQNLKELINREGPLPSRRAIDLSLQILAALRNAHRANIIHRDVKPHNIMVLADGRVKVTDFGIARAGVSEMTEAGSIIGTAQYLSPEQARGLPVGPASDLYSVGVVLYELVTGRVPFDGDSAVTVAMRHVQEPPRPPSALNPDVPAALERVILRALAKTPDRRYATADEMGIDLDRVRKGLPPLAGAVPDAGGGRTRRPPVGGDGRGLPGAAAPPARPGPPGGRCPAASDLAVAPAPAARPGRGRCPRLRARGRRPDRDDDGPLDDGRDHAGDHDGAGARDHAGAGRPSCGRRAQPARGARSRRADP